MPPKFEDEWLEYLEKNLPLYSRMPESLKLKLHGKIAMFVTSTYFEGCGELELSDEMIITIAGQACLLVANHPGEPYPNLKTVLVYPSAFRSIQQSPGPAGTVIEEEVTRLGESWSNGTVILAWDSVLRGAKNIFDGHNVTFHEFAHQLDQEDGRSDGVPIFESRQDFQTWTALLNEEFEELAENVVRRRKTIMDHYGATNKAEFFAVATEAFFEKPKQLKKKETELYEFLKGYFKQDPLVW